MPISSVEDKAPEMVAVEKTNYIGTYTLYNKHSLYNKHVPYYGGLLSCKEPMLYKIDDIFPQLELMGDLSPSSISVMDRPPQLVSVTYDNVVVIPPTVYTKTPMGLLLSLTYP